MKIKILLIPVLILIGTLIKEQSADLSSDNDKIYSVGFQLGLNQIKEMNLLPLSRKFTYQGSEIKGANFYCYSDGNI